MWYSGSSVSELRCWVRFESAGSINTRLSLVHFCNHWSRLKSSPRFACSSSAVFWGGAASCWWSVVIEVPRSFRWSTGSSHYPSKPQFKEIVLLYTCLLFLPFPPPPFCNFSASSFCALCICKQVQKYCSHFCILNPFESEITQLLSVEWCIRR